MTGGKQNVHSTGAVKSLIEAIITSRPKGTRKGSPGNFGAIESIVK